MLLCIAERAMAVHRRRPPLRSPLLLPALPTLAAQLLLLLLICALLHHAHLASSAACSSSACSDSAAPALCAAPANGTAICSSLRSRLLVSFPFFTAEQCHYNGSSFVIADCNSAAAVYPRWPGFTRHAMSDSRINQTFVTHMYNAFASTLTASSDIDAYNSRFSNPFYSSNGYMNLTWNSQLQEQSGIRNVCEVVASAEHISDYIPSSINLQNFAQSAFRFDSSNILLLFSCTGLQEGGNYSAYVIRNSSACMAYQKECNQNKDGESDCYQHMIPNPGQNLFISQLMTDLGCKQMMFFVALNSSLPAAQWTPGLVRLTWNLEGTNGLGKTLENCMNCFYENRLCGYDSTDNFQCDCSSECPAQSGSNWIDRNKLKIVVVAGSLALILFIGVIALLVFVFFRSKKQKPGAAVFCSGHDYNAWIKRPSFLSRKPDPILAREIPYNELVCATESFSEERILGDGGFGAVYKGVLADGCKVAVKRIHHDNYRRLELFYNEMKVLSSIKHPNLVKLCGFCVCERERELLLVFEYASQGTVLDHLHKGLLPPLSWSLRLRIACETADALSYLHNTVTPPIYHRDVKTANILLDNNFHAKLADFGLSKLVHSSATSHISTLPQGTPGYLDPEYHQCYQLTDRSDVYSLGVVLMELISGKLAVDMTRERGEVNLSTFAVMKIQCGQLEELLDLSLEVQDPTVQRSMNRVVELAFECLLTCRDGRPSMKCVAETLTHIRKQYEDASILIADKPFPSPPFSFPSTNSSHHSSNLSSS